MLKNLGIYIPVGVQKKRLEEISTFVGFFDRRESSNFSRRGRGVDKWTLTEKVGKTYVN